MKKLWIVIIFLFSYYPELKNIDETKNITKQIEEIITNRYKTCEEQIISSIDYYTNLWNKYNDSYINNINSYLNTNFDKEEISAYIGFIPIFPRYLDTCEFCLCPNLDDKKIVETAAHEICHFVWFNKFKEMYPNISTDLYEQPNIEWKLSEMVVDPILNSSKLQETFKGFFNERAYDNFYDLTYNNESVMDKLIQIFESDNTIENKINTSYEYVKKVFKEGE